jgi:ssDNA-binding Zn-finger/Zn-ribbon topoisomerase 1
MAIICPECGAEMRLRDIYRSANPDLIGKMFWGCSRFPECRATHGAHPDGRPLGIPGNTETKRARIEAHDAFDALWKCRYVRSRTAAYRWLQAAMGMTEDEAHIARFNIDQCETLMRRLEDYYRKQHPDYVDDRPRR